ncbi:MAG: ABC transporter ATP-binding protein [Bacteroidota bacterium]
MSIISINGLRFGYRKSEVVLKEVNMQVPSGHIYGFLGPNGAGKSTTIRSILGLLKPQAGQIQLFGKSIKAQGPSVFHRIGALIEAPSLYAQLNAIDHLKMMCRYRGLSFDRIPLVLEKVNLWSRRKKASHTYSTGMKQRLGLAMALLHDPELLILDEPTNGLDPAGITEFRQLIQELHEEGKTIFLSSHLLSEIERIATYVGILNQGKMVFEGSLSQLQALKASKIELELKIDQVQKALAIIPPQNLISQYPEHLHLKLAHKKDIPSLIKKLVDAELSIYEIRQINNDLENRFIRMTQEQQ